MTRSKWAGVLLWMLMIGSVVLFAMHWRDEDVVTYLQANIMPVTSVQPFKWPNGAVNVNTADDKELDTLVGINSSQIQALLDDRALYGGFDFPEDLIYVKGIGEKTLAKIYDQLDFTWREAGN